MLLKLACCFSKARRRPLTPLDALFCNSCKIIITLKPQQLQCSVQLPVHSGLRQRFAGPELRRCREDVVEDKFRWTVGRGSAACKRGQPEDKRPRGPFKSTAEQETDAGAAGLRSPPPRLALCWVQIFMEPLLPVQTGLWLVPGWSASWFTCIPDIPASLCSYLVYGPADAPNKHFLLLLWTTKVGAPPSQPFVILDLPGQTSPPAPPCSPVPYMQVQSRGSTHVINAPHARCFTRVLWGGACSLPAGLSGHLC